MSKHSLVVVVDDDESVRESLLDFLRQCGFQVEVFASAESFLISIALSKADCLVLDVAMPEMTGPELLKTLRASGRDIPTIFITAGGDQDVRRALLSQGAVECLFKPFSDTALLAALDLALRRS